MDKNLDNLLIICPSEEKINILRSVEKEEKIYNIKFMTLEEFRNNYFFSYNEEAYYYLLNKYQYNLDICKVYLDSLYVIDINKNYKAEKLNFLKELKKELIANNLLKENKAFKEYIKTKQIIVKNYYNLEKYEEEALNYKIDLPFTNINTDVVECDTLEEEVNDVCLKILKLLEDGVDINKIFLFNVTNDYLYTIEKLFKNYNIPINLDMNYSIYSTKVVQDYLNTNEIDIEKEENLLITRKVVNILNSLSSLDSKTEEYKIILNDKLKKQKISNKKLKNAVNIKDIYKESVRNDEYIFVLGFNQDILPKMEKDINYLSDNIKEELPMYTTKELNLRNKKSLIYILSNIKNLYLSYKKSSPFSSFYPSSLIKGLNLNIISPIQDEFTKSNIYNKLRLGEKLDLYYKYGEENSSLKLLNNHYEIPYKSYSNDFTGINNNIYLTSIKQPLNLSYSAMDDYSKCEFKYYVKKVLNLSLFEEQFPNFIGNLFHRILSLYQRTNFDFEKEFNKYLENRELSIKERILLIKLKKDLLELINSLKKQQLITGYDNNYLEKKIEIPLNNKKINVIFKGFIDKIMYYENLENFYFTVIDYKTGTVDTNIEPMKYGLNMQLPVYLYLIKYSNMFKKPIFTGLYYQNILFNYPTCVNVEEYLKITKDRLKLQGYSTEDTTRLERFDTTYEKSEYIKSMSYTEEKGFGRGAKVVSDLTIDNMIEYTKDYIDKTTDNILDAKFNINPKFYNGKNISCEFCEFKDLCFMKETDIKYLDKVEDLSFLGGDIDG